MSITPKNSIVEKNLIFEGQVILTRIPDNVILTPSSGTNLIEGAFIGPNTSERKSHHIFPIGVLEYLFHGLLPLQAVVNGLADGNLWKKCLVGDTIHALREIVWIFSQRRQGSLGRGEEQLHNFPSSFRRPVQRRSSRQ